MGSVSLFIVNTSTPGVPLSTLGTHPQTQAPAQAKEDNVKLSAKAQAQLLYQQGLSVTDIASQLGTTTQAVNDYLFITVDPALQKAIQSSAQA
jgi:DNA-binding NarL/FixJ family response regulator